MSNTGKLVVFSGFSGSGKGTIMKELMAKHGDDYALSVSATTRGPRPGEEHGREYFFISEEEFEQTEAYLEHIHFYEMHIFKYSKRKGTRAAVMPDQIDEDIKAEWQADVMELEEEVIFDKNETLKGKELYVFIEGKVADENAYIGRTYRDAPNVDGYIFINTDETLMTGDICKVMVTGAYEYDLIGELVK